MHSPRPSAPRAVLDGEIIALDEQGRPNFERLERRFATTHPVEIRLRMRDVPVCYVLFDILFDGDLLLDRSYTERRARLATAVESEEEYWRRSPYYRIDGETILATSEAHGLEGIVAKRLDSPYQPGKRTGDWIKIKHTLEQEFVLGGYVTGDAHEIGSLLAGYYDVTPEEARKRGSPPRLLFAGKVGTGYTGETLAALEQLLRSRVTRASPFADLERRTRAVWVRPDLVFRVEFQAWTQGLQLRHASFRGLRTDKDPHKVVRET
jgi:bifunctional non-homologous end joining protein LigD